jgi:hypothetical protein
MVRLVCVTKARLRLLHIQIWPSVPRSRQLLLYLSTFEQYACYTGS